MKDRIIILVPKALKEKAVRMKQCGLNVSQLLRNYLESYSMEEKSESVA